MLLPGGNNKISLLSPHLLKDFIKKEERQIHLHTYTLLSI